MRKLSFRRPSLTLPLRRRLPPSPAKGPIPRSWRLCARLVTTKVPPAWSDNFPCCEKWRTFVGCPHRRPWPPIHRQPPATNCWTAKTTPWWKFCNKPSTWRSKRNGTATALGLALSLTVPRGNPCFRPRNCAATATRRGVGTRCTLRIVDGPSFANRPKRPGLRRVSNINYILLGVCGVNNNNSKNAALMMTVSIVL